MAENFLAFPALIFLLFLCLPVVDLFYFPYLIYILLGRNVYQRAACEEGMGRIYYLIVEKPKTVLFLLLLLTSFLSAYAIYIRIDSSAEHLLATDDHSIALDFLFARRSAMLGPSEVF